ncbi:hypothetical protein RIN60_14890 [Kluyvera cryocrescens]|uniref:hypothetical protein n=1 Tax=Kluyvera cryocrescens TaxID=580 RepID=UPI0028BEEC3C|nr:hypothetical protein [Kluyvera cryocrescens]WNN70360.1 hypothetical protein RIN60_14890 [Kluyvera cryocrescens]
MELKQNMPKQGYVVIRCDDGVIVAKLPSFPASERSLMYCRGDMVSFMPLQPDEIVGTPTLFAQMLEMAKSRPGYLIPSGSVKLPS